VPAQEKLNRDDQIVAYIAGLGITFVIIAFILMGLGTVDSSDAVTFGVIPGVALIVISIAYWFYQVKPWSKFDDLTTPAFIGHAEHEEEAPVKEAEPEAVEAPVKDVEKAEVAEKPVVKEPAAKAPTAEPDDLTLIEGIGRKSAEALAAAGITTFAQVAAMSPEDLEKVIKDQKVRLVGSTATWPEQARAAAGGDLTALEDLQARIKGVTEPAEDDLTLIEGVGPKSAEALKAAGVKTFAQVAKMTPEALEKAIKDQKVRLVGSTETWPMQAELAAAGKLSELESLQSRIKGGVLQDE
jgi:predicted flap endonuclease-1-like 5' DNA nuclease